MNAPESWDTHVRTLFRLAHPTIAICKLILRLHSKLLATLVLQALSNHKCHPHQRGQDTLRKPWPFHVSWSMTDSVGTDVLVTTFLNAGHTSSAMFKEQPQSSISEWFWICDTHWQSPCIWLFLSSAGHNGSPVSNEEPLSPKHLRVSLGASVSAFLSGIKAWMTG